MYRMIVRHLAHTRIFVPVYSSLCTKIRQKMSALFAFKIRGSLLYAPRFQHAAVAELVDALDLGSSVLRRGGSTPSRRTKILGYLTRCDL